LTGAWTKITQHRSAQILILITIYLACASHLPNTIHQIFYTISFLIKDLLLWMLPFTVCFFIAHAISSFQKNAPLFILILFLFEFISNTSSVWFSFGCGHLVTSYLSPAEPHPIQEIFQPLFRLPFPKPSWWSADKGTCLGILLGLFSILKPLPFLAQGKKIVETILSRFFSRLIPIFILGFVARMYKTELLSQIFSHYSLLFLWLTLFLSVYIGFLFVLGKGDQSPSFLQRIKNLFPAASIAFSSGCSISTMPWTIDGTSKNLEHPDLAKAIIPATTNTQQIGDCIANTFLCFLMYYHFNGYSPDLSTWAAFSTVFVLARFTTAAILGGAIFIMLPIYESYLGFTPEMIATILAFNVILDPLITCTNVIANGALCRIFEKTWFLSMKIKNRKNVPS